MNISTYIIILKHVNKYAGKGRGGGGGWVQINSTVVCVQAEEEQKLVGACGTWYFVCSFSHFCGS